MATQATINKNANALLALYIERWTDKYGKGPVINSHRDIWAFRAMYKDFGTDAKSIIEYYFQTPRLGHPLEYLSYNYDKLFKIMTELAADEVKRKQLMEETRQRVEEANGNK